MACGFADRVNWASAPFESRSGLLDLSLALARCGRAAEAARYLEKFRTFYVGEATGVLETTKSQVAALIAVADSTSRTVGIKALQRVQESWGRSGFVWRELEALDDLCRVAPSETHLEAFRLLSSQLLSGSVAAEPARDRPSDDWAAALRSLTPAEKRVMQEAIAGKTTRQIADDLGRSYKTVRNTLSLLYSKFDTHDKSGLLARVLNSEELREAFGRTTGTGLVYGSLS